MLNILHKIGLEPIKRSGDNYLFPSPFRVEKTPSFWTIGGENWKDFGNGEGGDRIKFLMLYYKIKFPEAKSLLSSLLDGEKEIIPPLLIDKKGSGSMEILKIGELKNIALIEYCNSRCISPIVAKKYLREIYYRVNNKNYFALYFATDRGGGEMRNKYFKGCNGNKCHTLIEGGENGIVSVFEGFFDFLSLVMIRGEPCGNVIVLNGLEMAKKIDLSGYKIKKYYLDYGVGGDEYTKQLIEKWGGEDMRGYYKGFGDLNEYLVWRMKK